MRILFITYDLPYPLNSGGKIRAYHLIKSLAKNYQITLFSYYREEDQRKYLPELKKYCEKICLFKRERPWQWQNILRCLLTRLPFAAAVYHSRALEGSLTEELSGHQYDLVHFESFYPALYLPLAKKLGVKTILGNENVEYRIYQRYADTRQLSLFRWLLRFEVWRMQRFEEDLWRQADLNLAPSREDAETIEEVTHKSCPVIPNGVDIASFPSQKKASFGSRLIFVGSLIYQANNDAVKYFLDRIYPKVKEKFPSVNFHLVSWHKPDWLKNYLTDTSVCYLQNREAPIEKILAQADIFVAPIRVASGTNIKILEAMAAGLPVVTTSVGIEGIEAKKEKEVIVADGPEDFASRVVELLKERQKRQEVGLAGRRLVTEKYQWPAIGKKLLVAYRELIYGQRN